MTPNFKLILLKGLRSNYFRPPTSPKLNAIAISQNSNASTSNSLFGRHKRRSHQNLIVQKILPVMKASQLYALRQSICYSFPLLIENLIKNKNKNKMGRTKKKALLKIKQSNQAIVMTKKNALLKIWQSNQAIVYVHQQPQFFITLQGLIIHHQVCKQ